MAFSIGSNNIMTVNGLVMPIYTTATRPANPVIGQVIYNSTTAYMERFDEGNVWRPVIYSGALLYRQIITTSYVAGGYKDSSPWKNVNRMTHSTDVMINLGDLLATAANYTSGACSLTTAFMWCASPEAFPVTPTNTTVAFAMTTETTLGTATRWNLGNARNDCGTIFKETEYAYVTGGGPAAVDVFNLSTETVTAGGVSGQTGDASYQNGVSAFSGEFVGYWWGSSGQKLTFSTGTSYTVADASGVSTNRQQKGISSKVGRGYMGNEGTYNGGYNLRRYVISTDSYTTVAKPVGNSGEENFDMGQNWQYMMGMYDGAQNNRGWKFTYATDSGYELGSGSVRTGVAGGSSGNCFWRS